MSSSMKLSIKPLPGFEKVIDEFYSNHGSFHDGDAGLDLFCLEDQTIPARSYSVKVPLGVAMEAYFGDVKSTKFCCNTPKEPTGFYLYPRSSTGSKTPIRLSNSVGIIDAGYRGPLMAIVDNVSDEPFTLKKGERYFQVCAPHLAPITFKLVEELSQTSRGEGGFGSTGN